MRQYLYGERRWMTLLAALCLGCGLLAAPAVIAAQACSALQVDNAWVRAAPGAPVSAGYFDLVNPGETAITVSAVSSPQFGRVQMHESIVGDNGMATMKAVDSVVVAPGRTVSFAPGGHHLMMFQPAQSVAPGGTVTLELTCAGTDGARQVTASVHSMMPTAGHGMKMHHGK